MLCLSKRTGYALIALGYLHDHPRRFIPAREMAEAYRLPAALLMNLLKDMQAFGILRSTRGTKGGYQVAADLDGVSLHRLIEAIDGESAFAGDDDSGPDDPRGCCCQQSRDSELPMRAPLRAFHDKLVAFFKSVKVSDLVTPGRRIDVPLEWVSSGASAELV